jgi:hypothetical protein
MTERSLYQRHGGYDAIAAVVDDLLPRLQSDPRLGRFWQHRGAAATLGAFRVPRTERDQVLASVEGTKADIIEA